jgi:hypothetical protein
MMMMMGFTTHLSPARATQPIQETYRFDPAVAARLPVLMQSPCGWANSHGSSMPQVGMG